MSETRSNSRRNASASWLALVIRSFCPGQSAPSPTSCLSLPRLWLDGSALMGQAHLWYLGRLCGPIRLACGSSLVTALSSSAALDLVLEDFPSRSCCERDARVQVRWARYLRGEHPHKRQSILNTHSVECKSDLKYVLLLELDGKERGLQKQRGRQDELNEEKSVGPG